VLDCRELRNPYGVAPLKDMTVLDPLVKAFVSSDNAAQLL
jgi:RNase adaptor protein for sRNA GlmZ degradation